MKISHLSLLDFRSYSNLELELNDGTYIFIGENGEGKTNIIEAVMYLALLSSHRISSDAPLIKLGRERAYIRAKVSDSDRDTLIELEINNGRANRAKVNQNPVRSQRAIQGLVKAICFSPEDLDLVRGDPSERRNFLDQLIEQLVNYDCIVISDYDKGFISEDLLKKIDRARLCPVFVDTKKTSLRQYRHSIFKINQLEYQKLQSQPENLIVTEGDRGARYKGQNFVTEKATVVDVCGAGDMFLSALAYHYTTSKVPLLPYSIEFANHAAGIAVQHQGVYVLNENDVRQLMTKYEEFSN